MGNSVSSGLAISVSIHPCDCTLLETQPCYERMWRGSYVKKKMKTQLSSSAYPLHFPKAVDLSQNSRDRSRMMAFTLVPASEQFGGLVPSLEHWLPTSSQVVQLVMVQP